MLSTRDLAWLAGLLEGEGSFMYRPSDSPVLSVQMTDRDVVARVARMLGCNLNGPYVRTDGNKTTWAARVHGAKAIGWMMTLFTFLGERRQQKIREVLTLWKAYTPPERTGRFTGTPYKRKKSVPTCHPDKRTIGWGLCGMCYMRQWRSSRMAAAAQQFGGVLTIA